MGIRTIRVTFAGRQTELDFVVEEVIYPIREWLDGAAHQAAKLSDVKILPVHLVLFLLSHGATLRVNDLKMDYRLLKQYYIKERDMLSLERGNSKFTLILRRIFEQHGWDLNSQEPLDSQSVLTAVIDGDPISVSLFKRNQ